MILVYTVRRWRNLDRNLQIIDMGVQFCGPCALRLSRCHWVPNLCMSKNNTQNRTQPAMQDALTKVRGCKQPTNKCVDVAGRSQTWTASYPWDMELALTEDWNHQTEFFLHEQIHISGVYCNTEMGWKDSVPLWNVENVTTFRFLHCFAKTPVQKQQPDFS